MVVFTITLAFFRMNPKEKPCKGRREAKGYGCGKVGYHNSMRRGLCNSCWIDWIKETEEGKALAAKRVVKKIREIRKEGEKRETFGRVKHLIM